MYMRGILNKESDRERVISNFQMEISTKEILNKMQCKDRVYIGGKKGKYSQVVSKKIITKKEI